MGSSWRARLERTTDSKVEKFRVVPFVFIQRSRDTEGQGTKPGDPGQTEARRHTDSFHTRAVAIQLLGAAIVAEDVPAFNKERALHRTLVLDKRQRENHFCTRFDEHIAPKRRLTSVAPNQLIRACDPLRNQFTRLAAVHIRI